MWLLLPEPEVPKITSNTLQLYCGQTENTVSFCLYYIFFEQDIAVAFISEQLTGMSILSVFPDDKNKVIKAVSRKHWRFFPFYLLNSLFFFFFRSNAYHWTSLFLFVLASCPHIINYNYISLLHPIPLFNKFYGHAMLNYPDCFHFHWLQSYVRGLQEEGAASPGRSRAG